MASTNKPLLITVFADASRGPESSAFGYWFKSELHSGRGNGQLIHSKHTELLELQALYNAIVACKAAHESIPADYVLACDNINSLAMLCWGGAKFAKSSPLKAAAVRPRQDEHKRVVRDIIAACGGKIWLKHVKGHHTGDGVRSAVNHITDRLARQGHKGANQ